MTEDALMELAQNQSVDAEDAVDTESADPADSAFSKNCSYSSEINFVTSQVTPNYVTCQQRTTATLHYGNTNDEKESVMTTP